MTHPVVLCTDFGPASPYVGQMKLVLAGAAPDARIIDLAHDLPAQNVMAAAFVLAGARANVIQSGVICAVIDPGVGTDRRIVALEDDGGVMAVVPDNGLATIFPSPVAVHEVSNRALFRPEVSPVFHGRDVFAPVTAALANGAPLAEVGPAIDPSTLVPLPRPLRATPDEAEVVYADAFGNLITNLHRDDAPQDMLGLTIGGQQAQLVSYYGEAPPGALLCLIGSYDRLEVAVRNGSAAGALRLGQGARFNLVRATRPSDGQST